jgi:ankyrin repeat protein
VHFAAFNGQLGVIKFLIEEWCDYNDDQNAPLLEIVSHSVKYYFHSGAPVDTRIDSTGSTPLHWSVKRGDGSVPRYLISKGADVEIQDSVGRTAIFHAASSGTIEALKVLVEEGHANVLHRDKYGNTAFAVAESADMWEWNCAIDGVRFSDKIRSSPFDWRSSTLSITWYCLYVASR